MTFDWVTLGFQLVNVLVLLAILRHFLFRPVAGVIARRQAETDATLKAAADARAGAEAATARAKAEAEATAAARHEVLVKAQAEAEAQRAAILQKARDEAGKIVADGTARLNRQAEVARDHALARVRDLAAAVAERALATQPQGIAGYAARLGTALKDMPPEERRALLSGARLRLVSAAPLSAKDTALAHKALAGFDLHPAVETDPQLIVGLELRSESGAIRNSLGHDLDRIAEAMRDDKTA